MDYKYIHIFGIPVDQLSFKLDVLRHIESQCNENLTLADDGEKTYYDFDDFFNDIAPDLDCVWFSYDNMLDDPGFDGGVPYIVGIKAGYPWDREPNPHFNSETRAREFIARTLLPYVNQSKEKLRELCQYIEAPAGGE